MLPNRRGCRMSWRRGRSRADDPVMDVTTWGSRAGMWAVWGVAGVPVASIDTLARMFVDGIYARRSSMTLSEHMKRICHCQLDELCVDLNHRPFLYQLWRTASRVVVASRRTGYRDPVAGVPWGVSASARVADWPSLLQVKA
jgi:hypothetical protein